MNDRNSKLSVNEERAKYFREEFVELLSECKRDPDSIDEHTEAAGIARRILDELNKRDGLLFSSADVSAVVCSVRGGHVILTDLLNGLCMNDWTKYSKYSVEDLIRYLRLCGYSIAKAPVGMILEDCELRAIGDV